MRKGYSTQLRLDSLSIDQVPLNFECRSRIVPILRALQKVYSNAEVTARVMQLIEADVNRETRKDCGRKGMDYWHIMVLASVRLGCNFTYDHLHDLAENHGRLRAIMGIGEWDGETNFKWSTIRNNICLLKPSTIDSISHIIVAEGHAIVPEAVEQMLADSFVMPCFDLSRGATSIIRPRVRSFVTASERSSRCVWNACPIICSLAGDSMRSCGNRSGNWLARLNTLQAFIARTERVIDTTNRRVLLGESVPNNDKTLQHVRTSHTVV